MLALDTASAVSVGLARGSEVLAEAYGTEPMAHVESLMPLVRQVLNEAGIDLGAVSTLVVGLGPGPFTGLRVGIITARVLATVTGAAVHGVGSLDVIAARYAGQPGPPPDGFCVVSDARRHEVYWARYAGDGTRLEGPSVGRPETLPPGQVVGPAVELYPDRWSVARLVRLCAGQMAVRGPGLPSAGSEPLYLRRPDAAVPGRRKRVLLTRSGRGGLIPPPDRIAQITRPDEAGPHNPSPDEASLRNLRPDEAGR